RFWGKADAVASPEGFHLLAWHCLDVAACGRSLLTHQGRLLTSFSEFLCVDQTVLLYWLSFWLALHDIGKFSDGFQKLRPVLFEQLQGRTSRAEYTERHDSLGYRLCCGHLRETGLVTASLSSSALSAGTVRDLLQPIISAVTGHHGKPPTFMNAPPPLKQQFPEPVWKDVTAYLDQVKELFPFGGLLPVKDRQLAQVLEDLKRISWLVAGLAVAADWIGSNKTWFPFVTEPMGLKKYWKERALPQAERAVVESGIPSFSPLKFDGLCALYPGITVATPLQALIETMHLDEMPQLFIIEEVTGGGKTEAAVTLAHRMMASGAADGLYIAMPTMATANAMYSRIKDVYRKLFREDAKPSLVLAHSASRMALDLKERDRTDHESSPKESTASEECSAWLADNRKKSLLAQMGVGTIDQALLAILPARHQSMRLFGLCRKVLLVDEVHACDDYVHGLLCTLLEFHASLGGSAILLTATLPKKTRQELRAAFARGWRGEASRVDTGAYPLVTRISPEGTRSFPVGARVDCSRRVGVFPVFELDSVEGQLRQHLEDGQCACWVRNTVDDALATFSTWTRILGPDRVTLFHARFARFGPDSTADERGGRLLIATQVVEQSLDLDFDFMVSDLAPIDLIVQRAGRLRRHSRDPQGNRVAGVDQRGRPLMTVLMPDPVTEPDEKWFSRLFPKARFVYPHHGRLWLTARWLAKEGGFSMPEDARRMIEGVYGDDAENDMPSGLRRATQAALAQVGTMAAMARHNSLKLHEGYQASSSVWPEDVVAPTRLGEPVITVRLARWEQDRLVPWSSDDPWHAWDLSNVSVRRYRIAGEAPDHGTTMEEARACMPDGGKWCVIVPLSPEGDDWTGSALNESGRPVRVRYNPRVGLQFPEGENA
ncbi:MAG: CRISPR-associated helicase Cas3', partial [Chitinivibrionia bacterium]|nr:CRISPR-associated helicase Cas3' [Chitinivibrionia bacterium]